MAIFTVHFPPAPEGAPPAADRMVLLRDEFSWPAFIFGPFWLLWRRAWLAAGLWTLALLLVGFLGVKLNVSKGVMSYVGVAMAAILGFEGSRLIAWTLSRRGYAEADLAIGDTVEEAEEVFLHRWGAASAQTAESAAGERRD
jgi:hypothetical protein